MTFKKPEWKDWYASAIAVAVLIILVIAKPFSKVPQTKPEPVIPVTIGSNPPTQMEVPLESEITTQKESLPRSKEEARAFSIYVD